MNLIKLIGNREIKFRAWEYTKKRMFIPNGLANPVELNKKRYAHMQCTGLKAKNGKEIYEGDVVKCLQYDKNKIQAVIIWSTENGRFEVINDNVDDFATFAQCSSFEVIGNIFENLELLK